MTTALAIQEPASLVQVHDQCAAIEVWAERCESILEVQDALNKLAGIDEYLSHNSKKGRARVAAAMRRLEVRIGDLLGPAVVGTNGHNSQALIAINGSEMTGAERVRANEFRRLAANRDIVEATIAKSTDKAPANRRAVIRAIAAENTAKAHALQAEGLPQREIAAQLGVARAVVRRTLDPAPPPPPSRSEYHRKAHHIQTSRIVEQTFYALDGLAHGIKQADVDQLAPEYAAEWAGNLRSAVSQINDFIRALDQRSKEHNG